MARVKDQTGSRNPSWKGGISKNLTAYKEKYNTRHPEATRAHKKVYDALQSGKLVKGLCANCGSSASVHAHHDDYSKPLEVTWLCSKCHRILHGKAC